MLSIDLGTTTTEAAIIDRIGRPKLLPDADGEECRPTAIFAKPNSKPLFGRHALQWRRIEPAHCIVNFKSKLGSPEIVHADGSLTALDAATIAFSCIKEDAEREERAEVNTVLLTHPVAFRDDAKADLIAAAKAAGFDEVVGLLDEPVAAIVAYALNRPGVTANVMVTDVGGGTCDVAVARVEGTHVRVLATAGTTAGGNALNEWIHAHLLEQLADRGVQPPTQDDDPHFHPDLDEQAETAKRSLGLRPEVVVPITLDGQHFAITLSQRWLLDASRPIVKSWCAAVDEALATAGLTGHDIERMLLVGGGARPKLVQDAFATHTGLGVSLEVEPEKAVAYGGAIVCASRLAQQGRAAHTVQQSIRAQEFSVQNVTAHDLGIAVLDRRTGGVINAPIIRKSSVIPCQRTEAFFLEHEDQTRAVVEILQGPADAERDQCLVIGSVTLENLPREQKRTRRMQIDCSVDHNGMATVVVSDKVSGQSQTISINCKGAVASAAPSAPAALSEPQPISYKGAVTCPDDSSQA